MANLLITRHPGAVDWAKKAGYQFDAFYSHLDDLTCVHSGDNCFGILPVNIAEQICAIGASYYHLSLNLPSELRGQELTAEQLESCNARFEQFVVVKR